MADFTPTAWVRTNCPYSFKFRLFVTEAGLSNHFRFVAMDPDSLEFPRIKTEVEARSGAPMMFPTVEVSPNNFMSDSDVLIEYYAKLNEIDDSKMPTLAFYRSGLYVCYLEMFSILAKPLGWVARLGNHPKAFR